MKALARTLVASAVLLLAAGSAMAATSLGTVDNSIQSFSGSQPPAGGSFSDVFTFTLTNPGTVTAGALPFNLASYFIAELTVSLASATLGPITPSQVTENANGYTLFASGLDAGDYLLTVRGTVTGESGGYYKGTLSSVTAPVPEPETYGMMALGLGVLGFMARRRKSA